MASQYYYPCFEFCAYTSINIRIRSDKRHSIRSIAPNISLQLKYINYIVNICIKCQKPNVWSKKAKNKSQCDDEQKFGMMSLYYSHKYNVNKIIQYSDQHMMITEVQHYAFLKSYIMCVYVQIFMQNENIKHFNFVVFFHVSSFFCFPYLYLMNSKCKKKSMENCHSNQIESIQGM